jgi:hypothetical protein
VGGQEPSRRTLSASRLGRPSFRRVRLDDAKRVFQSSRCGPVVVLAADPRNEVDRRRRRRAALEKRPAAVHRRHSTDAYVQTPRCVALARMLKERPQVVPCRAHRLPDGPDRHTPTVTLHDGPGAVIRRSCVMRLTDDLDLEREQLHDSARRRERIVPVGITLPDPAVLGVDQVLDAFAARRVTPDLLRRPLRREDLRDARCAVAAVCPAIVVRDGMYVPLVSQESSFRLPGFRPRRCRWKWSSRPSWPMRQVDLMGRTTVPRTACYGRGVRLPDACPGASREGLTGGRWKRPPVVHITHECAQRVARSRRLPYGYWRSKTAS